MTITDTTTRPDTREMLVVHRLFRREITLLARMVRAVPAAVAHGREALVPAEDPPDPRRSPLSNPVGSRGNCGPEGTGCRLRPSKA